MDDSTIRNEFEHATTTVANALNRTARALEVLRNKIAVYEAALNEISKRSPPCDGSCPSSFDWPEGSEVTHGWCAGCRARRAFVDAASHEGSGDLLAALRKAGEQKLEGL